MKILSFKYYLSALLVVFAASSCEDQLDINENPNAATEADVQLVLPQAIVATAAISNQFNSYGAHFGGYMANAGGFSGFGNLLNYNLTPGDWNALWVNSYQDALQDLKYVMDNTDGVDELSYFNASAKIMTVVNYQRLVDAFGDIPYSEALRADEGIVSPAYDDAGTIYRDLFAKLSEAIATIDNANFPMRLTRASDPLFGSTGSTERPIEEQMADWKKYANTLKLRILIRLQDAAGFEAFVTEGFANLDYSIGFLDTDAIVDPGYELNRPNPAWSSWGKTPALALSNSSRIPTEYAFAFYNGKLSDAGRGELIYVNYPTTPVNQLGNENAAPTIVAGQVTWAGNESGLTGLGVLKGAAMGQPLMLAAESYLLQAEAQLNGHYGSADAVPAVFREAIEASFRYLYLDENETLQLPAGASIESLVDDYISNNEGNYLADIVSAANADEMLEAIITQKYIALNMINSDEAWNEYRRTGFPSTNPGGDPSEDIASRRSSITSRPDRLPTRILYPSTEQSYNAANYRVVDHRSDRIFWDPN